MYVLFSRYVYIYTMYTQTTDLLTYTYTMYVYNEEEKSLQERMMLKLRKRRREEGRYNQANPHCPILWFALLANYQVTAVQGVKHFRILKNQKMFWRSFTMESMKFTLGRYILELSWVRSIPIRYKRSRHYQSLSET